MFNDKTALRTRLLAARAEMSPEQRQQAALALGRRALDLLPEQPRDGLPSVVAGYVSMGAEPGTHALLDALRARGARVLLPVLLEDNDLDWGVYQGADALVAARRGLREPGGARLGVRAVCEADLLLMPGLAVDRRGVRLGRGGGSYDRVLERLAAAGASGGRGGPRASLVTLLYDGEVLPEVPAEPHDRPVDAAVTPSKTYRFDSATA
ncbi:5-formyltetrahydrofolate cyclo-ligase [Streptacidiphilus cavernicola]|uniref:5-formyltetrahydrofolate cyclo-ligase n=1 Tax=Streptacidiphilus cavernicola TaxID=3342716 RepID=A0ABV6VNV0_9ACTN